MLASGVIVGILLGLLVGRDWRRLAKIQVRFMPVLVASLVLRGAAPILAGVGLGLSTYLVSIAGTGLVAAANFRLPGMVLIAAGSLSNLIVVLANGGMPVDLEAAATAGGAMPNDALHVPLTDAAEFVILADVLAVSVVRGVYSIGDLLIAIGAFLLTFTTLARR